MSQRETATDARQGERGKPTLIALIIGVALALAAGAVLLTYQAAKAPPSSQSNQQPAQPKP